MLRLKCYAHAFHLRLFVQTAYRHQTTELKSVMAALTSRDEQLTDVRHKLATANQAQAADKQTLIDVIAGLKGEG